MALRKFMHPRNRYKQGVDFKQLANLYPDFHNHTVTDLSGKLRYNFKNEESLRFLAKTLFKHDFELDVDIPDEKLVPAMPLRLNYILWIEDLVNYAKLKEVGDIRGIDIGTGAVCVYPLLCAKLYGWKMTGTEISETSILSAVSNVKKNDLNHLVTVHRVKDETSMLTEVVKESELYSFTMCNPPFFNSHEFVERKKRLPPRNAATGSDTELAVDGGEKSFITRLIDESLTLRERVTIYTTMLGQKTSCSFFKAELKRKNIHNSTWTEFCQGHTKRWGLAWTFLSKEIVDLTNAPVIRTRQDSQTIKQPKDRPIEMVFPLGNKFHNVDEVIGKLKMCIQELKIEMKELNMKSQFEGWTCRLKAHEDSWSHARRKRRMAQRQEGSLKKSRLENLDKSSSFDSAETNEDFEVESSSSAGLRHPLLECTLMVGEVENKNASQDGGEENFVKIIVLYENGHGGKNALEALRQYLINRLSIREYLTIKTKSNKRKKRRKDEKIKSGIID